MTPPIANRGCTVRPNVCATAPPRSATSRRDRICCPICGPPRPCGWHLFWNCLSSAPKAIAPKPWPMQRTGLPATSRRAGTRACHPTRPIRPIQIYSKRVPPRICRWRCTWQNRRRKTKCFAKEAAHSTNGLPPRAVRWPIVAEDRLLPTRTAAGC